MVQKDPTSKVPRPQGLADYYEQFVWASIGGVVGAVGLALICIWLVP